MKKIAAIMIMGMILGTGSQVKAVVAFDHIDFFKPMIFDVTGAIARALQAAIKYFLVDDDELVAELVWKEGGHSGACGGSYSGTTGSAESGLGLSASATAITDIPAEKGIYPVDIKIQETGIDQLAEFRIQSVVQEEASLDQLSASKWAIQYRAQQRAIQAMTDALVMKLAYKGLAEISAKVEDGKYKNYSDAVSTVATRRLLLGELMALRKRVIAARIRARAETMEMNLDSVATAPIVEGGN